MGVPAGYSIDGASIPKPYGRLLVRHTQVTIGGLAIVHDRQLLTSKERTSNAAVLQNRKCSSTHGRLGDE